ncbi:cupin domain-containing protein [Pleurocapsa sp. PCC 7319]|uniref:cupin domain-containing protein n=1 Tax=Pleurocapsa sp. PCC 7319 TaxID=118161 RepID=UPI000344939B|nr:cupin domain-containing protein [Pleurocapsa sp. PCC 7319]
MNVTNISEIETLKQLQIADKTSENDAEKSMRFLGTFNQCIYGMVNFIGETPWELHPDDEYLQVIDGNVEVTLLAKENRTEISLSAGDIFTVPKEVWHRQFSEHGVKLMFITSSEGNQHSTKDNPNK